MKKLTTILLALVLVLTGCNNKDSIWNVMDDIDSRVSRLEALCQEMNTNIEALEALIKAQGDGDYITNITEIRNGSTVIGYTITFKTHEPITVYNGTNGKDGKDGTNGYTPVIGAKQDTDGIYYWTVDGNWLTDADGNKLRVSGEKGDKGDKGDQGDKGQDGADGTNGVNGNTPQLKIDGGYWYLSYDGTNWTRLGKATGENGLNGTDGKDGKDGKDGLNGTNGTDGAKGDKGDKGDAGDTMFRSVTQDANYVYFTLADGTLIKIAKKGNGSSTTTTNMHEYTLVDLGLPSGTLWANQNFCIDTDSIYRDHFYFSSLVPNKEMKDTIYVNGHKIQNGDSIAGSEYDVVTYYLGKGWYIPTSNNFGELLSNCTEKVCYAQAPDGSIYEAIKYTSRINGRSIQFPLDITPNMWHGSRAYYWAGVYLTSTYPGGRIYFGIKRYYDPYTTGWDETIVYYPDDQYFYSRNPTSCIRPVYNPIYE